MAAGFLYAGIAGFLKAQTGAHEVITTIMLNYIAFLIANYLVTTPGLMLDPHTRTPRTPYIDINATLPIILPGSRLHLGFLLALLAVPAGLVPDRADDDRLPAPGGRLQRRSRPGGGHLGRPHHGARDGDLRGRWRRRRGSSRCSASSTT